MELNAAARTPKETQVTPPDIPIRKICDYTSQMNNLKENLQEDIKKITARTNATALLEAIKMSCVATIVIDKVDHQQQHVKEEYELELKLTYVDGGPTDEKADLLTQDMSHGIPLNLNKILADAINDAKKEIEDSGNRNLIGGDEGAPVTSD